MTRDGLIAVFNELSTNTFQTPVTSTDQAEDVLKEFISVLTSLRRADKSLQLVSLKGWSAFDFNNDLPIAKLRNSVGLREEVNFLQRLLDKVTLHVLPIIEEIEEHQEYLLNNIQCLSLGLAHHVRGIAVSYNSHLQWSTAMIPVEHSEIQEANGNLEPKILTRTVLVHHSSTVGHVNELAATLSSTRKLRTVSADELWNDREVLFPNLLWIPRVRKDLEGLEGEAISSVFVRLTEIDEAVAEWRETGGQWPVWRSHVTPESESRRQRCVFADENGDLEIYETHARYTPHAGRIHFRVLLDRQDLVIGYVGLKL